MKHIRSAICLLLLSALLLGFCACGTSDMEVTEKPTIEDTTTTTMEETTTTETTTEEATELSETTKAEMAIFDAIDYSDGNFMTEAEFYAILKDVLALHDLELTRYPGENGYFYFNYSNLEGVRLLTIARSEAEIEADIEAAWADHEQEVEEYSKKREAAQNGETYTAPEEESTTAESGETPFDAAKDVENSDDYVISFVLSAADTEMDQQVMFLVSAAVWCIFNPHFNNTDDAFAYLWRALYTTYGNSEGLSASTIDGIDSDKPFTIPGNATEAWLGTDDAGNYVLAITNYAVYDDIIDISDTANMGFAAAAAASASANG